MTTMMNKKNRCLSIYFLFLLILVLPVITATPSTWKYPPERIDLGEEWSYIYQFEPSSEITVIQLAFQGGKAGERPGLQGTAFLTTRLKVEMPTGDDIRQMMHLGSTLLYHVEGDYCAITIKTLSENLAPTLRIVCYIIKKPLISGLRIENLKKYLLHRQKGEEDTPEEFMIPNLLNAFFPQGTPPAYGGSIFGSKESLEKIKKEDILHYYTHYFNRSHLKIAVCTNLLQQDINTLIKENLKGLEEDSTIGIDEEQSLMSAEPAPKGIIPDKRDYFIKKDNQQVLISYGVLLPGSTGRNYTLNYMLDILLGKGIGSKLWSLRAQEELSYTLNTHLIQMKDAGLLVVYLKTDIEKKDKAQQALKTLLTQFYQTGVNSEELSATQAFSASHFLLNNETKVDKAQNLAHLEALGLGGDFLATFFSYLNQVTLDEFNTYIKAVMAPHRLVELIIGPQGEEMQAGAEK